MGNNTNFCDNGTVKRDIYQLQSTIWHMDSWQISQHTPEGVAYGRGVKPEPGHKFDREPDGSVVFQYTHTGFVRLMHNGKELRAPAGYGYLFPSDVEVRWKTPEDPAYECTWVRLYGAGLFEHWQFMRQQHGPLVAMETSNTAYAALLHLIQLKEAQTDIATEALAIHEFVMALYQHYERGHVKNLQPVERAVRHIMRYPFHEHSLKEIAQRFEVSREHVTRVFQEQYGQAPATWLREQRFKRAKEILQETVIPIKDVAVRCGFGSVDVLARLLHKEEGMSPTAYRDKHYWKSVKR